jgi:hypothetical protein
MPGFADSTVTTIVTAGATATTNIHLVVGTGSGGTFRAPSNPTPADGAPGQPTYVVLSWAASGPATDSIVYDLYFGTSLDPSLLISDLTQPNHTRSGLDTNVTYYWRVVAHNKKGESKSGPVWSFSTSALLNNTAPTAPNTPTPPNGASSQPYNVSLRWNSVDPDGDALVYDVYFGTSNNLTESERIATGHTASVLSRTGLTQGTTYYWKVVARDNHNGVTPGPVWTFTTRTNLSPNRPAQPAPANGAVDVPLNAQLRWTATDDDADPLTFDLYLGTTSDASTLVASGLTQPLYSGANLTAATTYYWKIVAKDGQGGSTVGPVWSFTTADPLTQGLVAYYQMDGNALDATGHGHNGEMFGTTSAVDRFGASGGALSFDNSDYIRVPHAEELSFGSSEFTIAAWIRLSGEQTAYAGLVVKCTPTAPEKGYQFIMQNPDNLAGQIGTNAGYFDFKGSLSLNDGSWHFVALVVTRATKIANLYVDGNLVISHENDKLATSIYGTSPLLIGVDRQSVKHFQGRMDDIRLYNIALTQAQLRELGAE